MSAERVLKPFPCPSCETGTVRLAKGPVSWEPYRGVTVRVSGLRVPRCSNKKCGEILTQEVDERALQERALAALDAIAKPRTPKPQPAAPVEAEGWYALMHEGDTFLGIGVRGSEVSSRENAVRGKKLRGGEGEIVRILPDGAHEAAIAKAREEGAAAALHDARRTLLDLADDFTGDHAQGLRHAVRVIHDKIKAAKEAGKVGG